MSGADLREANCTPDQLAKALSADPEGINDYSVSDSHMDSA